MSTPHIADDLPRLLTGEATRDEVLAAAEHLRHCDDCRQELVSTTVAHASLASARRFAPEVLAAAGTSGEAADAAAPPTAELPDLSALFAEARSEEAAPAAGRRRRRLLVPVAAAVVGAAIAGTTVGLVATSGGSSTPATTVALSAFDTGHVSGKAVVKGAHMRIDAAALPALDAQHRYEVWLTDSARTRMQPLGWINTNGSAELTVPAALMSSYRAIEVSVQKVDAPSYDYSGTSVLRGTYG
jgi:hypothetical protein